MSQNVLDKPLEVCSTSPMTGYYGDGFCNTGPEDTGTHTVCGVVTQEFLDFTKSRGNDLTTVVKAKDKWCLCSARWLEAYEAGMAPGVILNATNKKATDIIPMEALNKHVQEGGRRKRKSKMKCQTLKGVFIARTCAGQTKKVRGKRCRSTEAANGTWYWKPI